MDIWKTNLAYFSSDEACAEFHRPQIHNIFKELNAYKYIWMYIISCMQNATYGFNECVCEMKSLTRMNPIKDTLCYSNIEWFYLLIITHDC